MDIKRKVAYLKRKYGTSNPFDIASAMGTLIFFEDLGTVNGYYNKPFRIKQIHINQNLPRHMQTFTCAHELGHSILHPNANTPFLRSNTFLLVDKMEIESNKFALELLIDDETLEEYKDMTTDQLARFFGYNKKLIELRLKRQ